jgi:hypothetical protein
MSRGQRTDLFISLKQRMLFEEALQKRAIDYLNTKRDDDYEPLNNKVMKMRYSSWQEVFSEDLKQIDEHIALNSQDVSKSDEVQKDITKRQSIYSFIESNSIVSDAFNPNEFFRKYTTPAATYAINMSLRNMKNASKLPIDLPPTYNDIAKEALKNIQTCYGWSDTETAYFIKFLIQCKNRLYNIRNNYNIMLALYGDQGSGKTEFANALYKAVNNTEKAENMPLDNILGSFGTLDVAKKLLIKFDEFGFQHKENLDALKTYIDGGIQTINRKYQDPIAVEVISSFILTTNIDPAILYGNELQSRRIMVINFDKGWKSSIKEVSQWINILWANLDNTENGSLLKQLGFDDKCLIEQKKANDLEDAFLDWWYSLPSDIQFALQSTSRESHMTLSKFKLEVGLTSDTLAKAYLSGKYFEVYVSGRNKWYYATDALININKGE